MRTVMELFSRILLFFTEKLKMLGAVALMGMAVLTCLDVVGRLFKHPIFGSVELVSFMAVLVVGTAIPVTQAEKNHIGVDLFVRKLPKKIRLGFELCTEILSFFLFVILTWQLFLYSLSERESGEVSMNLHFPVYCIIFFLACCCVILCLVILTAVCKTFTQMREK